MKTQLERLLKESSTIQCKCLCCERDIKPVLLKSNEKPWRQAFENAVAGKLHPSTQSKTQGTIQVILCDDCIRQKMQKGLITYTVAHIQPSDKLYFKNLITSIGYLFFIWFMEYDTLVRRKIFLDEILSPKQKKSFSGQILYKSFRLRGL